MLDDELTAECYVGLAKLVKDPKYEHIQIQSNDEETLELDPVIYYLKKSAQIYELICSTEHPTTADGYSKIALAYQDRKDQEKALEWMRKAFCVFYSTMGINDQVTIKAFETLIKLEKNVGTEFTEHNIDHLAAALMAAFEDGKLVSIEEY